MHGHLFGIAASWRNFLTALLLVVIGWLIAPSAFAQNPARATSADVQAIRNDLKALADAQAKTGAQVEAVKAKLDDTGWKALDFATQVASTQWAMFGTGLAILGLIVAVAALGAYQFVVRVMESKMKATAQRLETTLNQSVKKEEQRLQTQFKLMMEVSRQAVQSRTFSSIGYAFWEQHNQMSGTSTEEIDEKRRNLASAIHLSQLALECARKAAEGDPEWQSLLATAQSNTAYYLTDLGVLVRTEARLTGHFSAEHQGLAVDLARKVISTGRKAAESATDNLWCEWIESGCWTLFNLGDENEKKTAMRELRAIYENKNADEAMLSWIRKKYFKNEEPVWS